MILRLYGADDDEEPEVFLRLVKDDDKICIVAYGGNDHPLSTLIEFLPDGTMHRNVINPDIGFKTDNQGRLKVSN